MEKKAKYDKKINKANLVCYALKSFFVALFPVTRVQLGADSTTLNIKFY